MTPRDANARAIARVKNESVHENWVLIYTARARSHRLKAPCVRAGNLIGVDPSGIKTIRLPAFKALLCCTECARFRIALQFKDTVGVQRMIVFLYSHIRIVLRV